VNETGLYEVEVIDRGASVTAEVEAETAEDAKRQAVEWFPYGVKIVRVTMLA
jgi:hypothetical protein